MRFSEIPGLDGIKGQLVAAVQNNHVAHAQLFFGQPGSGNLAMAFAYTAFINCENPSETDSCGTCGTCQKIDKLIHPDVQYVYPVSSTKSITGKNVISTSYIKEWRSFISQSPFQDLLAWSAHYGAENKQANISKEESRSIIKNLSLKAFDAKYKVMLIWLPENMNVFAANGILKILEEPPQRTVFLLVTNDYEKLLTTITSRCQLVHIPHFQTGDVVSFLSEHHDLGADKAERIASIAGGSISKAINLIDAVEDDTHKMFRDWMRLCWTKNLTELAAMNDVYGTLAKTSQKTLLQYGLNMMRNALVSQSSKDLTSGLNMDEQTFVNNFGKALTVQKIELVSNELNRSSYHLERNANAKILFLDLSLTIGQIMTSRAL